jgi:hypothetical protein
MVSRWDLHSQLQDQLNSNIRLYNCLKQAKPSPHLMTEIHANLNIMEPGLYLPLHPDSIFIGIVRVVHCFILCTEVSLINEIMCIVL